MKNENKFKIGQRVLVSNQYFMDKMKIDLPLYAKVIDVVNDKVRIEDKDGLIFIVDSFNLEFDTVRNMQVNKEDTKQDKAIKEFMHMIAKEVNDDNPFVARKSENYISECLCLDKDDTTMMINELNVRRALYKYETFAKNQNEREKEYIDKETYFDRSDMIEAKVEVVKDTLRDFGIFEEFRLKEAKKQKAEMDALRNLSKLKGEPKKVNLLDQLAGLNQVLDALEQLDDSPQSEKLDGLSTDVGKQKDNKNGFSAKPGFGLIKPKKAELPDCLIDMTELAAKGRYNEIIGREDELATVAETLARKEIRNPMLIGKPGAGKTAVVEELVKRSYNGEIPHLRDKHYYELRMNDLVANTMYRGQLEQKLKNVMQVLEDDPNVILFIDEIHMIVQAGTTAEDKNDVANALKPYLTSEISIIGATTFDEYKATFANDGALARRFNPISIEEKTKEESIEIINKVKERFEKYHHVELSKDAVVEIINHIERNESDNSLIAGALTAVDTVCTKMKIKNMTEEEALRKWEDEVVLSVTRSNKGGKTSKIGFNTKKKDDEIKETITSKQNDDKEKIDEVINEENTNEKTNDDEVKLIETKKGKVILIEEKYKNMKKIEQKENSEVQNEKDNELEDELDLRKKYEEEYKDLFTSDFPTKEKYIEETGDELLEFYDDFILEYIDREIEKCDEEEQEIVEQEVEEDEDTLE
ncbi:MAG: AAA family ATPase [Clostridia bacterium]|nr:AAA family ATPase [Clostridia bacterium]